MQKVILASPTTLIALLRAVAYGWTQQKREERSQIGDHGKELYDRLRACARHLEPSAKVWIAPSNRTIEPWGRWIRALVPARKFTELGPAVTEEIIELQPIEKTTRTFELFDNLVAAR